MSSMFNEHFQHMSKSSPSQDPTHRVAYTESVTSKVPSTHAAAYVCKRIRHPLARHPHVKGAANHWHFQTVAKPMLVIAWVIYVIKKSSGGRQKQVRQGGTITPVYPVTGHVQGETRVLNPLTTISGIILEVASVVYFT